MERDKDAGILRPGRQRAAGGSEHRSRRFQAEYVARALPAKQISAEELPGAAVAAMEDLGARITTIFGPMGGEAIFRRSLSRTVARYPILAGAGMARTPASLMDALRKKVKLEDPAAATEIADAVRDIMAGQITLLVTFIGEDLVRTILGIEKERRPYMRAEDEASADE